MLNLEILRRALDSLALEIVKRYGDSVYMEVYLVGGSALLYREIRETTVDVDAIYPEKYISRDLVKNVADKLSLPLDWLNRDFMYTSSYSPKLKNYAKRVEQYRKVITVYKVDDLTLLCMKLVSFRYNNHDIHDINSLHQNLPELSTNMITERLSVLYGSAVVNHLDEKAVKFINTLQPIDYDTAVLDDMRMYAKEKLGTDDLSVLIDKVCAAIPDAIKKDMPTLKQAQAMQYWHRYKNMIR